MKYFTSAYITIFTVSGDAVFKVKNTIDGEYLAQIVCYLNKFILYWPLVNNRILSDGIFTSDGLEFKTFEEAEHRMLQELKRIGYKLVEPHLETLL
jgi:hypothetical protein